MMSIAAISLGTLLFAVPVTVIVIGSALALLILFKSRNQTQ